MKEYFDTAKEKQNLFATYDPSAYEYADVIIVDINLDVEKRENDEHIDYSVDLSGFKSAIKSLGSRCKENALILVETTVPPGTCEKVIKPIIQAEFEKRNINFENLAIGHSYERVMPGPNYINSIKNFYRVFSGINNTSAERVKHFLKTIISTNEYPLTQLRNTNSTELAKVLENSYRAMNISFMVEWSRFAEVSNIDLYEVVNAIKMRPTHSNMMYPGIGVGGYCLTKDPLLASWASQEFFGQSEGLNYSEKAVFTNDKMPFFCAHYIVDLIEKSGIKNPKLALLGVAYGPGIGDTRFTPVKKVFNILKECNEVICHDPYVDFWEEENLHLTNGIDEIIGSGCDFIVITTGHKYYVESINLFDMIKDQKKLPIIIDTVGLLDFNDFKMKYTRGVNFFVLGTGN